MDLTKQDIMQYLRTVGLLEWNLTDIKNDIEALGNERQQLFVKRSFEKQQFYPLSFCVKRFAISLLISVVIGFVVNIILSRIAGFLFDPEPYSALDYIVGIPLIIISLATVVFALLRSNGYKLLSEYIKSKKSNIVNSHNFSKEENQRLKDAPSQDADLEYQINALTNLANRMDHELQQAFELNVIHYKYRNLQAVCTLYEYFEAGSADTLKEAINKYDNESRLDNISAQLGELNKNIKRIYDEMLYQSQLLEQNNELARQQLEYSRVTAVNTQQVARNTKITAFNTSALLLLRERELYYRGY